MFPESPVTLTGWAADKTHDFRSFGSLCSADVFPSVSRVGLVASTCSYRSLPTRGYREFSNSNFCEFAQHLLIRLWSFVVQVSSARW